MLKLLWLTLGILSLILGIIGLAIPLLPTTPFVLLAAASFAKSSATFYDFLVKNKYAGPIINHWKENRTIPIRAKIVASVMMSISILASIIYFFQFR